MLKSLSANVDKLAAKVEKLEHVRSAVHATTDSVPMESSKSFFNRTAANFVPKRMPAKSIDEPTKFISTKRIDAKRPTEKEAEEVLDPLMIGDYVVLKSTEGFAKGGLVTGDLSFLRLGKQSMLPSTSTKMVLPSFLNPRYLHLHETPTFTPRAGVQKQPLFNEHREPLDYENSIFRIVPMLGYRQVSRNSSLPQPFLK
jgi:hypothetical protein